MHGMSHFVSETSKLNSETARILSFHKKKLRTERMARKTSAMNLSLIVTLMFVLCGSNMIVCRGESEYNWSREAAEEAETVAAIECSGHGRAYLDGLVLKGHQQVCECNPCYTGSDCSKLLSNCSANAGR
ncbi:hypothetical protein V8G54_013350 [Vigna mungo]|uniref:Alliinase EGF-like domain-containing protein n=1 Tax=Vigna mungo TaxID=3915 RepID=A0AAQ3S4U8_VIGMU